VRRRGVEREVQQTVSMVFSNTRALPTIRSSSGSKAPYLHVLGSELQHDARFLGHREGDAAVVLGECIGVKVRVNLLRDRDARVAEDLGELEDVAA
jgi:hypothetical protein